MAKLKVQSVVVSSKMVRRLAEDWEREAKNIVKETGDKNNDVSHAIRWCRRGLLSALGKTPNAEVSEPPPKTP